MRINVRVKPNAKINKVDKLDENNFVIYVTSSPIEGRANKAVLKLLHKYFRVPLTSLTIKSGLKGKHKVIEF